MDSIVVMSRLVKNRGKIKRSIVTIGMRHLVNLTAGHVSIRLSLASYRERSSTAYESVSQEETRATGPHRSSRIHWQCSGMKQRKVVYEADPF